MKVEKRFKGVAENELSTITMWEVKTEDNDFPVIVVVWYTVGSPGFTWGFSVDGKEVRNVTSSDKGYLEIYKHDLPIPYPLGEEYSASVIATHYKVLEEAIKQGFIEI